MKDYSAITAHYIDHDWNLKAKVLDVSAIEKRHTAVNLASHIEDNIITFDIHDKVGFYLYIAFYLCCLRE